MKDNLILYIFIYIIIISLILYLNWINFIKLNLTENFLSLSSKKRRKYSC